MRALQDNQGQIPAWALKSVCAHGKSNEEEEAVETRDRVVAYYKVAALPSNVDRSESPIFAALCADLKQDVMWPDLIQMT